MEEVILNIEKMKIKALKRTEKFFKANNVIGEKIIYTIPLNLEIYKNIPTIVKIDDKKFYKTDINALNQTHFKLIEI